MTKKAQHIITFLFLVAIVLFVGIKLFDELNTLPLQIENAMTIAVFVLMVSFLVLHIAHTRRAAEIAKAFQQVDVLKQEFIAMAGSEMRTPITNIRAYVELLRTSGGELTQEQKDLARKIENASGNLKDLVSDMVESTELERDSITFEYTDFDIETLVSEVVEAFTPIAREKGLQVSKEGLKELVVHSDRVKVRRALVNLVSNAIKYTPKGSVIVSYLEEGDHVEIHVRDSGIGISEEDLKKLFQKFYRIKSKETETIPGTGLGLWLTRAIIRKLGGNVEVISTKGVGTTFIISLPVTRPAT